MQNHRPGWTGHTLHVRWYTLRLGLENPHYYPINSKPPYEYSKSCQENCCYCECCEREEKKKWMRVLMYAREKLYFVGIIKK